ncbi:MAG: hypothetical protein ACLUPK_06735 [Veillonella sp.]
MVTSITNGVIGIRFDMTSAFGINLKQGGYVLYVNPFILLRQPQML